MEARKKMAFATIMRAFVMQVAVGSRIFVVGLHADISSVLCMKKQQIGIYLEGQLLLLVVC